MNEAPNRLEGRVVIFTLIQRDAELSADILARMGIVSDICITLEAFRHELARGAGAVLMSEEMLGPPVRRSLSEFWSEEPAWSHLPFVILTRPGGLPVVSVGNSDGFAMRNTSLLERPVRTVTLVSILKAALADRERQYQTRNLLLKLQRSNVELNDFASIASHDLQEPLRTISNYVQLLKRKCGHAFDEDATEYSRFIVEGTQRMRQLILALLTYAQVGAKDVDLATVEPLGLLEQVLRSLEISIKESGARLKVQGNFPPIRGDATQIAQLFQNLVHNALKFQKPGATPEVTISARYLDGAVLFSVRDNGIGVRPQDRERIFRIFQRLHEPGKYTGSGVGLAVCHKIVERHHGRIWVESSEGNGSTFLFTLPSAAGISADALQSRSDTP